MAVLRIDQRRKMEARPAKIMQRVFNAEVRIQHPLPDEAGNDQRHGEGIEEDRTEQVFLPDALVHEDREQIAEHQ